MKGIKRRLIALAAGAALAMPGSLSTFAAPAGSPSTMAPADNGVTLVKRDWKGGGGGGGSGKNWGGSGKNWGSSGKNWGGSDKKWSGGSGNNWGGKHHGGYGKHRGGRKFFYASPFIAAPFLYYGYNDYDDYGYSSYGYSSDNSCYRACRYEHGPRYCRYNWEDYC